MSKKHLVLKSYAKVNLTLEVLGRRADGYHDIASIIQTIGLFDTLGLELSDTISLTTDMPELDCTENLVFRAASLLKKSTGFKKGVHIDLIKRIPVSAGLGGGSSNAAVTLIGLNRLWGIGLSQDELLPLALELGSDVPFFLYGGTAMIRGRGERIRVLPSGDLDWFLILNPQIETRHKTAMLYGKLTSEQYTRGALTRKLEARIQTGKDVPPQFLFNVFDGIAFDAFPLLERYWDTFHAVGGREIHLAGSGPALFAPVSRREIGTAFQLLLRHTHDMEAYLVPAWHGGGVDQNE